MAFEFKKAFEKATELRSLTFAQQWTMSANSTGSLVSSCSFVTTMAADEERAIVATGAPLRPPQQQCTSSWVSPLFEVVTTDSLGPMPSVEVRLVLLVVPVRRREKKK